MERLLASILTKTDFCASTEITLGERVDANHQNIISGHSHSFDTGVAKHVGINAAIVFNHIAYWIRLNASKKDAKMIDGKFWMYETQQDMAVFLDYMTVEEVKRSVVKLLDAGLLIKGNYNKNPFDKTNWYALADQSEIQKYLTKAQFSAIDNATARDPERPIAPSLHIHKEQHKKTIIIEEEPPPAPKGGNNKFFQCLEECKDISDRQKSQLSKYPEEIVASAVKYCYHPTTKLEGPAARIKQLHAFCKNPSDYTESLSTLDDPGRGKTVKEKILSTWKRGVKYNGYEFSYDDNGPYFIHPNGIHAYPLNPVRWTDKMLEKIWNETVTYLGLET